MISSASTGRSGPGTSRPAANADVVAGPAPAARALRLAHWGIPAVALLVVISALTGPADVPLATAWESVAAWDPASPQHEVVRNLRLPRTFGATLVGAALGAAGALMQGITRNPLAGPSILGVNSGAALALAVAFAFFPGATLHELTVVSMGGATLGVLAVHALGALTPGGFSPVRLVLAGAALSAMFGALTTGLVTYFTVQEDMLFFAAGGVSGMRWSHVATLLPWAAGGLAGAVALAPAVAVFHLGDDAATGLGLRTAAVRRAAAVIVVVLAGAAVSVAGPIGFVGLVVPHVARMLFGADDRIVIPASAVIGGVLLCAADIATRLIHPTREVPLGMVTALVGVPFFLHLVRRHDGPGR